MMLFSPWSLASVVIVFFVFRLSKYYSLAEHWLRGMLFVLPASEEELERFAIRQQSKKPAAAAAQAGQKAQAEEEVLPLKYGVLEPALLHGRMLTAQQFDVFEVLALLVSCTLLQGAFHLLWALLSCVPAMRPHTRHIGASGWSANVLAIGGLLSLKALGGCVGHLGVRSYEVRMSGLAAAAAFVLVLLVCSAASPALVHDPLMGPLPPPAPRAPLLDAELTSASYDRWLAPLNALLDALAAAPADQATWASVLQHMQELPSLDVAPPRPHVQALVPLEALNVLFALVVGGLVFLLFFPGARLSRSHMSLPPDTKLGVRVASGLCVAGVFVLALSWLRPVKQLVLGMGVSAPQYEAARWALLAGWTVLRLLCVRTHMSAYLLQVVPFAGKVLLTPLPAASKNKAGRGELVNLKIRSVLSYMWIAMQQQAVPAALVLLLTLLAAVDVPAAALPWLYRGGAAECVRSAAPMLPPFVRALLDATTAVVLGAHAVGTAVGLLF